MSPGVTPRSSRSSGCTDATGSGSIESSAAARRVIAPCASVPAGACDEHRRIVRIGTLGGRNEIRRHEPATAVLGGKRSTKTTGSPGSPSLTHGYVTEDSRSRRST